VGGALRGNAGGRGGDIGQWVSRATLLTRAGERLVRERAELQFGYRQSNLDDLLVLSAEFELERDQPDELTKRMQKQWIVKKASQPLGHQSCACLFKNPRGMSAGLLIDQAGLKGHRVGGAWISDRHGNYAVTDPGAKARDVLSLIDQVRQRVSERMGVQLELGLEVW
jgi:UDP-N-acetylmuramate dehydrogenase